ncbi:hypothetical protein IAD21_03153 [Abditibacteriota bacterium]|nr:hypothetical protein IAD21_03153 [Abditibacteriota bacterium]
MVSGFSLSCSYFSPAVAQETVMIPAQRLVTVTGEADVKIVPDEALLTLGLETSDADLAKAKLLNNERIKGVKAIAAQFKIAPTDVKVDYISIDPNYWRGKNAFTVRRTVTVTVKNVAQFEAILTRMVQNNRANSVQGVQFRTSQLRKYRDQARELAVHAAKEKATALAHALGAEIGRPYSIREEGANWWSGYSSYWGGSNFSANTSNSQVSVNGSYDGGSPNSTLTPGQIAVNARITVSFELK